MRIYSMTATFGKLEHQTLTLNDGLNIIHAPNEWGKSTWCAFLASMFYGIDTKAKTTKTSLADKDHYAPWSGSPMEGRIDLNWNGTDITIQRRTKGRIPLGDFQAYETKTGVLIPELTAANCGQQLLGVERSVFLRSAFIRLSDLPVTNDAALLQRLNALVSTGDESIAGEKLAHNLKELKNRCRYHRTGLIPQAEEERADLEEKIREHTALESQLQQLKVRLSEVENWITQLENHQTGLEYTASRSNARVISEAVSACDEAAKELAEIRAICQQLPDQNHTHQMLEQLRELEEQQISLQEDMDSNAQEPKKPVPPRVFAGLSGKQAIRKAWDDQELYYSLLKKGQLMMILGGLLALAGAGLAFLLPISGFLCIGMGLTVLICGIVSRLQGRKHANELVNEYGDPDTDHWTELAADYSEECRIAEEAMVRYINTKNTLFLRQEKLANEIRELIGDQKIADARQQWQQAADLWDNCVIAHQNYQQKAEHVRTLQSLVKPANPPRMADNMHYTQEETLRLLVDAHKELHSLQNRIGQYQGRMESLGSGAELENRLANLNVRINKLEDIYAALCIAQEKLAEASTELQRRFSPRITKRAQELMAEMTGGRYDRLLLGNDFTLQTGAPQEDTLHDALWRSDGTIDQLYLSLRLAVAEALTEKSPLILDDALVRFDDARLASALKILNRMAEARQVILFTCQSREKNASKI